MNCPLIYDTRKTICIKTAANHRAVLYLPIHIINKHKLNKNIITQKGLLFVFSPQITGTVHAIAFEKSFGNHRSRPHDWLQPDKFQFKKRPQT